MSNTPPNILLSNLNRPDQNCSVHAEPSASSRTNVSPCLGDDMADQPRPTSARASILHQSLHPVTLKFEDVGYSIKLQATNGGCVASHKPKPTRTVLNGVSGIVLPGELLAMLGPSGSGKTTLLTALGSRLPGKISGKITYNGQNFSSSMKHNIGFVSQDDVLYPHLSVLETLTYTALLRLPKQLTKEEKIEQVETVIMELGLNRCRDTVVGGPLLRGISGGERKRVSIGQEMLVNPSLLLLDEPTSGLDSTTAQRIIVTLQRLARGGRTVITTIHQPSSRLYRMFDKVMVLSDGYPIYSGHADRVMEYFGSIGYEVGFNFINPADVLLDLANDRIGWNGMGQDMIGWKGKRAKMPSDGNKEKEEGDGEVIILCSTNVERVISGGIAPDAKQDEEVEYNGRLDHQEDQNTTKQFLISSYKKYLYPALKIEIQQTHKDTVVSSSRTPSSRVAQGIGLALGAILMDVKQGTTLASVTTLVFLLVGGYYIQHMPPFIAWLKYISYSHYCYKLLVGVQYSVHEVYECGMGVHCRVLDFPGIKCVGLDDMWIDVAALAVMLVGYRVLAYVALRMGQPH
ncbi:hypothetical protein DVH24_040516 [Malus domestica]|uniref:ABC transporter domain-containing protein n=1 Tax=Malus domestica TaxID=3750 RepID=A0A498I8X0_MALDO|nr:hypothetical protein DVH24_040516 [Malus domestica]